ncbi:hypothetical protein, variant [Aphanomyces invadans]|uniref:PWWP domain-containing protein n=1 Tax=Aphanomyces invadans TaxID=157072 RepID=A0A024UEY0_9STRA|nr:hypothetical protein, variant [Aphanomyces invadans]ETW04941.1 hypothetical protein, variant [Aphanomyces invadans]|eukprot:XP_008866378.1 hypothetical protein, variant [Aphanomyces invadans]
MAPDSIEHNAMAWVLTDGTPWWPVFVIDPADVPLELRSLGRFEGDVESAKAQGSGVLLVFNFGRHTLSIHKRDAMKPWNCPEHPTLLRGHPLSAFRKLGSITDFLDAMNEATEYNSKDTNIRQLLPIPQDECCTTSLPHNVCAKEVEDPVSSNYSAQTSGEIKRGFKSTSAQEVLGGRQHVEVPFIADSTPSSAHTQWTPRNLDGAATVIYDNNVDCTSTTIDAEPLSASSREPQLYAAAISQGIVIEQRAENFDVELQAEPTSETTEDKCRSVSSPREMVHSQRLGLISVLAYTTVSPNGKNITPVQDGATETLMQSMSIDEASNSSACNPDVRNEVAKPLPPNDGPTKVCLLESSEPLCGSSHIHEDLEQLVPQAPQSMDSASDIADHVPREDDRHSVVDSARKEVEHLPKGEDRDSSVDALRPIDETDEFVQDEERNMKIQPSIDNLSQEASSCPEATEVRELKCESDRAPPTEVVEPQPRDVSIDEKDCHSPVEERIVSIAQAEAPTVGHDVSADGIVGRGQPQEVSSEPLADLVQTEPPGQAEILTTQESGRASGGSFHFTNALADPELMALAGVLGISIEAHTPTFARNILSSSSLSRSPSSSNKSNLMTSTTIPAELQTVPNKPTNSSTPTNVVPVNQPLDTDDDVGIEVVAWAKRRGDSWWPAYICDPTTVRKKLKISGQNYNVLVSKSSRNADVRLIYFFGAHILGSTKCGSRRLKAWNCTEKNELLRPTAAQHTSQKRVDEFHLAVTEAQAYLATEENVRVLPALAKNVAEIPKPAQRLLTLHELKPEDDDMSNKFDDEDEDEVPVDKTTILPVEVVAWVRLNKGPYWPVYFCDSRKLHNLGTRHTNLLTRARKYPDLYRLAYVFGKHEFCLQKTTIRMKPWNCADHLELMQGEDSGLRHEELFEDFSLAVIEAEEYLAADEATRTLPFLTNSEMILERDADEETRLSLDGTGHQNHLPEHSEQGDVDSMILDVGTNCLAWGRSRGYPWWPAYVCDPYCMPLDLITSGVPSTIYAAKRDLTGCRLVYYFGRRTFGLLKSRVRSWGCECHALFTAGHPAAQLKDPSTKALFMQAKSEALAFLVRPNFAFLSRSQENTAMSHQPPIMPPQFSIASYSATVQPSEVSAASEILHTTARKRGRPPKTRDATILDPPIKRGRLVSIAPATASNASIAPTSTASGDHRTQSGNNDEAATQERNTTGVDPTDGTNEAFSNEGDSSENDTQGDVNFAEMSCGFVAWTRSSGLPWWPVFVCDPSVVRANLFHLGDVHQGMLAKAKADPEVRLVFFFGLYNFGLVKVNGRIPNLKVWKCREYKIFEQGFPVGTMQGTSVAATFYIAIQEAQEFVTKDENSRVLPRMVPSDMNPQLEPPRAETTEQANDEVDNTCDLAAVNTFVPKKRQQILPNIPFGQVVWSKPSRSPWWPVYVIDPSKLRHNLYHLGKDHRRMLAKAQQNLSELRLVYYFGRYIFGLVKVNGKIKPWQCVEHEEFLLGYPESAMDGQDVVDEFYNALKEAQDFLSADEDNRLLPFFVKSDMQPDLEPPSSSQEHERTFQNQSDYSESDSNAQTSAAAATPLTTASSGTSTPDVARNVQNSAKDVHPIKSSTEIRTDDVHDPLQDEGEFSTGSGPSSTPMDYFDLNTTQPIQIAVTRSIPALVAQALTTVESSTDRSSSNSHLEFSQPSVEKNANGSTRHVTEVIPAESLCWARWTDGSWWPVYVCDHHKLRDNLHNLGTRHHYDNKWIQVKKAGCAHRLVYYFGRYCFGLQKKSLQPWKCADHEKLLRGHGHLSMQKRDVFLKAIQEAQDFESSDPCNRLPPHMVPSDINPLMAPPPPETAYFVPDERMSRVEKAKTLTTVVLHDTHPEAKLDTVAWAKSDGYPWWPVYICDPEKVKHTLLALGNGHEIIYNDAVRKPSVLRAVYFFGSHRFGLSEVHTKAIQPWDAENHAVLLQGVPKKLMGRKGVVEFFAKALDEANEFIESCHPVLMFPDVIEEELQHEQGDSNLSKSTMEDTKENAFIMPYDCVAWAYLSGFPWLPVYVIDPFRLQHHLENLGNRHAKVLDEARLHADTYRIVYYFGSHNFGLHKTPHLTMRKWGSPEHDSMCVPNPHKSKRSSFRSQVKKALAEAEVFLASSERIRVLPKMVASDMLRLAEADRLRAEAASTKALQDVPDNVPTRSTAQTSVRKKAPTSPSKRRSAPTKSTPSQLPTPTKGRVSNTPLPTIESEGDSDSSHFEKLLLKQDKKLAAMEKKKKNRPNFDLVPFNSLAWALLEGYPWLPVYVLDPFELQPELHLLGNGHGASLRKARKFPDRYRIVYYFSSHNFGLHLHPETTLRSWNCPEHATFVTGFPKSSCRGKKVLMDLIDGVKEAECFAASNPRTRCLPYMVPSDTDPALPPPSAQFVSFNSLAWAITEGYPWMPVYVFNPFQLRFKLLNLGSGHRDLLRRARASPEECRIVFYFGSHSFGIHKLKGTLKPWNCPEHSQYLEAKAESLLYIKKSVMEQFDAAMDEVEMFSSAGECHRLLPFMDPSDFEDDATAAAAMSQWQAVPDNRNWGQPVASTRPRKHQTQRARTRQFSPPRRRPAKRLRLSDKEQVVKQVDVIESHQKALDVKHLFESKLAWVHWGNEIWWPVYICSPKPVYQFSWGLDRHMESINYADVFVEVYHFGTKSFVEHPLCKLKPWRCSEHDEFVQSSLQRDSDTTVQFKAAFTEAEDYAASLAKYATDDDKSTPPSPQESVDMEQVVYMGEVEKLPSALPSDDEDSGEDTSDEEMNEEDPYPSSDEESAGDSDDKDN